MASLALLVVAAGATGCSGDDDGGRKDERGASAGVDSPGVDASTDAAIGTVRGRLTRQARARVVADVTEVVERWVDRGYAGGDVGAAFADFTKEAGALARKQRKVMTGIGLADAEVAKRTVRVDVLAPKGKPAGATARFRVSLSVPEGGTELLSGRLMLSPTKEGWKVFGFDVVRGGGA